MLKRPALRGGLAKGPHGTLGLNTTAEKLGKQITATVPLDTVLIEVAVTNLDPTVAAKVADAVGKQFTTTVADLESVSGSSASPVKVSIVSSPTVPTVPISPKPVRNLALGVVLGLLLGLGLALLRDLLDTTIKVEGDCAEVTDAAVIGGIAFDPEAPKRPLIVQANPHSPRAEAVPDAADQPAVRRRRQPPALHRLHLVHPR